MGNEENAAEAGFVKGKLDLALEEAICGGEGLRGMPSPEIGVDGIFSVWIIIAGFKATPGNDPVADGVVEVGEVGEASPLGTR